MRHLLLLSSLSTLLSSSFAQESPAQKQPQFNWQLGPVLAKLGKHATINIPEGFMFLDKPELAAFFRATENFENGREVGVVAPKTGDWFVVYEFDDVGYVKDDEKDKLDADRLFQSMSQSQKDGNEERRKRGWREIALHGWVEKPHYDTQTHNLEWSIKLGSPGEAEFVNHKTRLLGRRGVMNVELVVDERKYAASIPQYRDLNKAFSYTADNQYSAWVKGDKVAEYGLGALVLGGAAAAAAKTGLLKGLWKLALASWKLIVFAFVFLLGSLKKLLFDRGEKSPVSATEPDPPATS